MTRRRLLAALAAGLCSAVALPAALRAAERSRPLDVTYYYLPG